LTIVRYHGRSSRARDVHKSFDRLEVLKGIDLDIMPGEVVVVLGPSGSGKSTFLRCINHLEAIQKGLIEVDGEQIGYRVRNDRLERLSPNGIAASVERSAWCSSSSTSTRT
jgi:polar amino acid transport system ATP-binding protein